MMWMCAGEEVRRAYLGAGDQVLCERGGEQAGQDLLHAGPQLYVEQLPPGAGLREAAGPAGVHHALGEAGQDLVEVVCEEENPRQPRPPSELHNEPLLGIGW